ncbi:hypothetical protein RSAG8_04043, partial [Rhizoctonia solani AG-8 WAC10335]
MRLLVRIDNALAYALRPGSDLKEFEDQVQMIQYEIQQLSKKGIGPDFTYRLTSKRDWNCYFYDLDLRDLGWKATPIGRTASGSATRYYVHTTTEPPTLVHRNESGLVSVKEVLLGFYRGAFLSRVGVLDNPTFHYTGPEYQHEWSEGQGSHPGFMRNSTYFSMTTLDIEDEGREMSSIPGPIHILVGARPRFHLLMSFELQSQLYTVIKPTQEPDVVLKDMRGALHSCADVLARHNAQGRLGWTLYQLKSNREQGMETLALQQVELPLMERQTTLAMSTGPLQSLSYAFSHIVGIEKQQGYSEISWLLEIGTIPMAIKQKYAGERGLTALAERWECMPCSGYMDPSPFSHSVLGSIYCGSAMLAEIPPPRLEIQDIFKLNFFVKGLRSIRVNRMQAQYPQDSVDTLVSRFIRRWNKYRHPNVLSLKGIRIMPRKGIGLVFPRTQTKSLREYLDMRPEVDRGLRCAQVSSGLTYLHEAKVIHGDLRAANLLVSITGEAIVSDPIILADNTLKDEHSRFRWMAPEIIKGEHQNRSSDVYSLGMTILEIITDAPPYAEKSDAEVLDTLSSEPAFLLPERPEEIIPNHSKDGNDLWRVLLHCWGFDRGPNNRLLAAQVAMAMKSITRDGLKKAAQAKIDTTRYTSEAFRESYELSEIDSGSILSSGHSTSHCNDPGTNNLATNYQENSDSASHSLKVAREVVRRLALHGCENITDHIDEDSFGPFPLFRGGFGDVFRGSLLSSLRVAVKTPHISSNILGEDLQYIKATREIHTWSKCDHPNVLHFLGLAEFRGQIGMVAPWMENGSLPRYLEKVFSVDRCKLCTQICEGVAYLHVIGIVHGDLKGENVLVSGDGVAVIGDFGGSLLRNRSLKIIPLEVSDWVVSDIPVGCEAFALRCPEQFYDKVLQAPEIFLPGGMNEKDESTDKSESRVSQAGTNASPNTRESDIYALGMTILVSH